MLQWICELVSGCQLTAASLRYRCELNVHLAEETIQSLDKINAHNLLPCLKMNCKPSRCCTTLAGLVSTFSRSVNITPLTSFLSIRSPTWLWLSLSLSLTQEHLPPKPRWLSCRGQRLHITSLDSILQTIWHYTPPWCYYRCVWGGETKEWGSTKCVCVCVCVCVIKEWQWWIW